MRTAPRMLVSVQDLLGRPSGIRTFLTRNEAAGRVFITRSNILREYAFDEMAYPDIAALAKAIKGCGADGAEMHSVLDASCYGGLVDVFGKLKIPRTYFCHALIDEECDSYPADHPGRDLLLRKRAAQHELFEKAEQIVFFNKVHRERVISRFPHIAHKSKVYALEIPFAQKAIPRKGRIGRAVILYAGRLSPEKGVLDLARAYAILARRNPRIHLVLLGATGDDPLRKDLEDVLKATRHEILSWTDRKDELARHYMRADVVVVPSRYDSQNLSVQDALRHGREVIMSDIPVFEELYLRAGHGIPFEAGNPNALAAVLRKRLKLA